MLVFHHNDADGRCAAAIVRKWQDKRQPREVVTCVEIDYRDDQMAMAGRPAPGETVAIVDFSFEPRAMDKLFGRTKHVIWCDHHVTAKDYDYRHRCQGLQDFGENEAGCELAWRYFFPKVKMPDAVRLLGEYDAWRIKDKRCFPFYEGLKMEDTSPESGMWNRFFDDKSGIIEDLITRGEVAVRYRDQHAQRISEIYGYAVKFEGHAAWVCNTEGFGRAGLRPPFPYDFPLLISFIFDGERYTVSLYAAKEGINVGEIARKHGGGGHKGAAGFICSELPFKPMS